MLILRGSDENTVIGMGLNVLLQILRSLEGLAAEVTLVRFERDMNTNVRSDVITLHRSCATRVPLTSQIEVIGALSAHMLLTQMVL